MSGAYTRDLGAYFNDAGAIWANHYDEVSGTCTIVTVSSGSSKVSKKVTGTCDIVFTLSGLAGNYRIASGLIDIVTSLSGSVKVTRKVTGTCGIVFGSSGAAVLGFTDMPPAMHAAIIDPYSGGAWLWLVELYIPGYSVIRYAKDRKDITYAGSVFTKGNFVYSSPPLTGDGSIPRIGLSIPHETARSLESKINTAEGGGGGKIRIIRAHEDFLDKFIIELEQDIKILTAGSDSKNVIFQLGIPDPLLRKVPIRRYSSKICPWSLPGLFKGIECQYAGGDATCTGKYEDCYDKGNQVHFGAELGLDPNAVKV